MFWVQRFWDFISEILTFPIASKPLSNRRSMPSKRKNMPKPDRPIPISLFSWQGKITQKKYNYRASKYRTIYEWLIQTNWSILCRSVNAIIILGVVLADLQKWIDFSSMRFWSLSLSCARSLVRSNYVVDSLKHCTTYLKSNLWKRKAKAAAIHREKSTTIIYLNICNIVLINSDDVYFCACR